VDDAIDVPRMYLLGVVSFGMKDCGKDKWPGVYTRTTHFMDWIMENLTENKKLYKVTMPSTQFNL